MLKMLPKNAISLSIHTQTYIEIRKLQYRGAPKRGLEGAPGDTHSIFDASKSPYLPIPTGLGNCVVRLRFYDTRGESVTGWGYPMARSPSTGNTSESAKERGEKGREQEKWCQCWNDGEEKEWHARETGVEDFDPNTQLVPNTTRVFNSGPSFRSEGCHAIPL